jgi:hypothetical protein
MADDEQIRLLTEIRDSLRELRAVFAHTRPSRVARWLPVVVTVVVFLLVPVFMMWLAYEFAWKLVEHAAQ